MTKKNDETIKPGITISRHLHVATLRYRSNTTLYKRGRGRQRSPWPAAAGRRAAWGLKAQTFWTCVSSCRRALASARTGSASTDSSASTLLTLCRRLASSTVMIWEEHAEHTHLSQRRHSTHPGNTAVTFGRRFYPKRLTKSTFVEGEAAIYHCGP